MTDVTYGAVAAACALAVVATCAAGLASRSTALRVLGGMSASLLALASSALVAWSLSRDEIRDALFWPGAARVYIMYGWLAVSCSAFLWIAAVSMRYLKASSESAAHPLPARNTDEQYGRVSRLLHWLMAAAFLMLLVQGSVMARLPVDREYREAFYVFHKTLGILLLGLTVVRLVWHCYSPKPSLSSITRQKPGARRLATHAHRLLYAALLGIPVTGYLMSTFSGKPSHFFLWELPMLVAEDRQALELFAHLHKFWLPWAATALIILHVAAAVMHTARRQDSRWRTRMLH